MLRDKQKKLSHFFLSSFICILAAMHISVRADLTTLAKNDPIPMFTTLNLDDALLLTREQLLYKFDALNGWDYEWADKKRDHVNISISPSAQNADRGKTIKGQKNNDIILPITCPVECDAEIVDTPLGDLTGRTNMIALLYGNRPAGSNDFLPGGPTGALSVALKQLFGLNPTQTVDPKTAELNYDPDQMFGFFSFPLKYRKRALRFEATALLYHGIGLRIQAGFANIRQVSEAVIDLTKEKDANGEDFKFEELNGVAVDKFLMDELQTIAEDIQINLCDDFIETSLEDIRFNLFWRQFFPVNEDAESSWARFLAIPYFEISGSISPVKKDDFHHFFAAPFGNNGHKSFGMTAGINLDFIETIEIGGEVGFTHFFKREFCNMPIPNSKFQYNLFPYSTNVSVQPGENWYFCARLAAYHFLDRLSMHFEWYVLDHQPDHINLLVPDPAFLPEVLECRSSFKVKLGNVALNYDFSPNFNVGLLWQIPFSQRNAYRSSTIMAGLNVTF
jgi:hypothetical protein